jgi:hypothetical protein
MTTPLAAALRRAGVHGQPPATSRTYTATQIEAITDPAEALLVADEIAAQLRAAKAAKNQPRTQQLATLHQAALSQRSRLKAKAAATRHQPQQTPPPAPAAAPPPARDHDPARAIPRFYCAALGHTIRADELEDLSPGQLNCLEEEVADRLAEFPADLSQLDQRARTARNWTRRFARRLQAEHRRRQELAQHSAEARQRQQTERFERRCTFYLEKLLRQAYGDQSIEALQRQARKLAQLSGEADAATESHRGGPAADGVAA